MVELEEPALDSDFDFESDFESEDFESEDFESDELEFDEPSLLSELLFSRARLRVPDPVMAPRPPALILCPPPTRQ